MLHPVYISNEKGLEKYFLPATMRFHANCWLHPTSGRLMQVMRCGRPKGLFFQGSYRSPDRVQGRLLYAEHHLALVVAAGQLPLKVAAIKRK